MDKRALLLSGSIGLGHDMMARACAEVLDAGGWHSRTRDSMALLGPTGSRVGGGVTRALMRSRGCQDALHFAHLRTGSPLAVRMAGLSTNRLLPALRAELAAEPASLIVSVFATGAAAAAALARDDPARRTVVLCTDACVHRLWVWPGTDLFLVTSPAAEMSVRRFLPSAEVRVVPAPVRASFFTAPNRSDARALLDIPAAEPCVLMMDSGWGFGPTVHAAGLLARAGVHVLAVAGRDARLARELTELAAGNGRVHAFGLTDEVPLLMAAADSVVTLPGATTCSEARALGTHPDAAGPDARARPGQPATRTGTGQRGGLRRDRARDGR